MNDKKYLVIIVVLVAINIFTLINFLEVKQQNTLKDSSIDSNQANIVQGELNAYKVNFSAGINNSNIQLPDMLVNDSLSNEVPLKMTLDIGHDQMLVCRFSQMHCESCVNSAIQNFKEWVKTSGVQNVMFLGGHLNNRIFKRTIPLYGIQGMKVYNASSLNIPAEELGYPYFFILDHNLQISNVFVPDKGQPALTKIYLEEIQERFY